MGAIVMPIESLCNALAFDPRLLNPCSRMEAA